jgi:hypothetical protein
MTRKVIGPTGSRRRHWSLFLCLAVAVGAFAVLIPGALAVHDTGAFELDGNATNGAADGDDWDNVCHQVLGSDCSTNNDTTGASAVDWVAEPIVNSTIFTGGGSKDPNDVSQWAYNDNSGGLPAKDNLLHSFAARYPNTSDGDVLYFGSDRLDNSGDAVQGFWFFQNKITLNTANQTFIGLHKTNDLLVLSDFSNGGGTSTIAVYAWDPTCASGVNNPQVGQCGAANLRLKASSTNANCANPNPDTACGIVNAGTITMPWSFTDKSGTPNNQALNGEFFEGGVNLTALGLGGLCFASVASETRASTSPTATLKDFILGNFGECVTTVHTTPSAASVSIGTGSVQVTDTATVTVSGAATWSGSVQFSLCGVLSSATGCATGGTAIGSPVSIDNTTTQPITSPAATVTSVGTYCWRADFTPSEASAANGVKPGSDGSTTECFTVTPVTPSLATSAGPDVQLGNSISDTATLSGTANRPGTPVINPTTAGAPAGGTITFTAYGPNNCTTVAFTSAAVPVSGDGTYGPVSFTPTAPGTYHWVAVYSGDPPNTNGTDHNTSCNDANEDVVVTDTTTATSAQTWLPNDTGTITATGGAALNGTLSIQLYTGDNCGATSGSAVSGQLYTKTLTNATTLAARTLTTNNLSYTVAASASVSWKVTFTSTDANVSGSSHCESTSLTIIN